MKIINPEKKIRISKTIPIEIKITRITAPKHLEIILEAIALRYTATSNPLPWDQEYLLQGEKKVFKSKGMEKILIRFDLKAEDIENLTWWIFSLEERIEISKKFWLIENLRKNGSIGKDWAAGYSITLDQYSIDWTEIIQKRGFEEIVGHKKSLSQVERILARSQINNVLLVGEPGIGRKSIIHALTQKVLNGQSLQSLNYKRVVELDLTSLFSEITNIEEVESILESKSCPNYPILQP